MRQDERANVESELKAHILAIHKAHPYYGYPRMTVALSKNGYHINHKKTYRLMRALGIKSVIRKKRRYFGKVASIVHPNRLAREFKSDAPGMKLVTDITYLPFANQFYYLSAVQDLYHNEIVGYRLSNRNDLQLVLDTLDDVRKKTDVQGAIIHSDQGFQYTSAVYNKRLDEFGMVGSHSRKGNCLDNACIESFFSHLKSETLYINHYTTEQELLQAIERYIDFYNNERFQKKLGHLSPVQYREKMAA